MTDPKAVMVRPLAPAYEADFTAHSHPVLAVPCPSCQAPVGSWCRRPSGHRAANLHRLRGLAADEAWLKQGAPNLVQTADGRFVIREPADEEERKELARARREACHDLAAERRKAKARARSA